MNWYHIPMLSKPKKPPANMFLSKGSLRFTHLDVSRQANVKVHNTCTKHYTPTHTHTPQTQHTITFCITLPIEVQNQFMEAPLQELHIPVPLGGGHLVHSPHRPCMHGWVDIAEVELICRDLPVGGHVPLPHKKDQLLLGKFWVHFCEWNHVESQVPRGILQVKRSFV